MHPQKNDCDVLQLKSQTCFDLYSMVCIDWTLIVTCMFLGNLLQLIYQASLAKSREWTLFPTELDMMQDPELDSKRQEQSTNPD